MKKIIHKIIVSAIVCLACFSCKYDFNLIPREYDIEQRSPDFLNLNDSDVNKAPVNCGDKFSVILVADTHFGRNGWFKPKRNEQPFYDKLETLLNSAEYADFPPAFTLHMGDNSDTGKQADFDEFKNFEDKIAEKASAVNINYNSRIYSILGNHDLYNNGWKIWQKNTWPGISTYYFTTEGSHGAKISWYFLDSASGILGTNQLEKFAELTANDSNVKIVSSHYPINVDAVKYYSMSNPLEIAKLSQIYYSSNTKWSFEGHYHPGGSKNQYDKNGNFVYHEEVLRGFLDKKAFGILTVDLSGSEPLINLKTYTY